MFWLHVAKDIAFQSGLLNGHQAGREFASSASRGAGDLMFWFVVVLSILSPVSFGRTATQVQHFFGGTNCGKESCKEGREEGCNRKASCEEGCKEGCKEGCEEVVF